MSSFDLEPKSLFDTFREIEEGVYFKHYGMELPQGETEVPVEMTSFGDHEEKALLWQRQNAQLGDSVALHTIICNSLYGEAPSQNDMMRDCIGNGLFRPQCGSSFDDVVEMLKDGDRPENDLMVDVSTNVDLTQLLEDVDSRGEVICYVNTMLLESQCTCPGLNADGLVHVIAVEFSDTEEDYVVINDTSSDNGAGKSVPLARFLDAWATSDNTVITVMRR